MGSNMLVCRGKEFTEGAINKLWFLAEQFNPVIPGEAQVHYVKLASMQLTRTTLLRLSGVLMN